MYPGANYLWHDQECETNNFSFVCEDGFALNPLLNDTDGDSITEDDEISTYGTNPNMPDTDLDGLDDYMEAVTVGCLSAITADTDGDNLCDGNTAVYDGSTLLCSAGEDMDEDGVVDPTESNFCNTDTDADTLDDGTEVLTYGTDPTKSDTDDDTMPDAWEVTKVCLSATVNDASSDSDSDTLTNLTEYGYNSGPVF